MPIKGLAICAGVIASLFSVQPCFADACQELSKLTLENTVISTAKTIPAGPFEADVPIPGAPKLHYDLPSYCRVTGSIHPTSDSDIRFEAWLPVSGWNGRYQQVGNGGLAGSMPYPGLASTLSRATATAATDDGHVTPQNGFDATWTIGHPEKLKDYGDRAVHLTAKVGQALVRAYYSKPASYNYFIGCSDGGRESLMEAQRYPEDFDGYLVGAPGIDIVNGAITHLYSYKALRALGPAQQLSPTQLEALSMKVLASCDALDGIKDGALRDPRACKFDPKVMICKPGDKPDTCLTAAQADAVRKIYDGPKDAKGAQVSFGNMGTLGTEYITWPYIVTDGPEIQTLGGLVSTIVGTLIYGDPKLDPLKIDLAQAARDSAARVAPVMNP
ncbi:MAG TPA: tannase/feruloyl esterase family alpha/beta hydrolase, partial [Alphaproteobacteria bacterium]|nr:tannase/feruloyl esterase family alpha/beta hydrolase [Alphaproteobacteria bacterium]